MCTCHLWRHLSRYKALTRGSKQIDKLALLRNTSGTHLKLSVEKSLGQVSKKIEKKKYFGQLFTQKWIPKQSKNNSLNSNTSSSLLDSTGTKIISCFIHRKKHFFSRYFNKIYKLLQKDWD